MESGQNSVIFTPEIRQGRMEVQGKLPSKGPDFPLPQTVQLPPLRL